MPPLLKEHTLFLLISDKVFFKTESFARVKGGFFFNGKKDNFPGLYKYYKSVCT